MTHDLFGTTVSVAEFIWVTIAILGLWWAVKLTLGWRNDRRYALEHLQDARAKAGLLLCTAGGGVSTMLAMNMFAGLISSAIPTRTDDVIPEVTMIVIFLTLGQISVVVMLKCIDEIFKDMVRLGMARLHRSDEDRGV